MRLKLVLTWKWMAGIVGLGIAGALLISWSGLVSIAASSGHWSVTRWFLGWTMENAVESQSLLVSKPEGLDLDDPTLVLRSAAHYATACSICHGAPGVPQSPVVQAMTPSPPRLEEKVSEWSDEELFWIVKYGIKYSGMPAWPTQDRDDEVWAQVAFLRALPGMTLGQYAELALRGEPTGIDFAQGAESAAAPDGVVENALADCALCHGRDGLGQVDEEAENAFPAIAGQPAPYLYATLRAFALEQRRSGFMEPPASRYEPKVLEALARYFSAQPNPALATVAGPGAEFRGATIDLPTDSDAVDSPLVARSPEPFVPPLSSWPDEAGILEREDDVSNPMTATAAPAGLVTPRERLLELGRRIAVEGVGPLKIPACQSCHGRSARKNNPYYPYLEGQPEWYLSEQLSLWQTRRRGGTVYSHIMSEIVQNMSDNQIAAVAAWYAEQPHVRRRK